MKTLNNLFVVFVAGLLVLSATGCEFSGGGHLPSLMGGDAPGKVTFAMHGTINEDAQVIAGNGQYNDHALNVKVHLDVTDEVDCDPVELKNASCDLLDLILSVNRDLDIEKSAFAFGNYSPQPKYISQPKKAVPGGCFVALVVDAGESGSGGDILAIALLDGVYDGYFNCGVIEGGNIQANFLP